MAHMRTKSLGFWRRLLLGVTLGALLSCSGSAVQQQARALDISARLFNAARPVWIAAYEAEGERLLHEACPAPPCARAALEAVQDAHDRRWSPVAITWEAVKVAHDAWRLEIERCRQADAGQCEESLGRLGAAFLSSALRFRCSLRALGRTDLDPMPGAFSCDVPDALVAPDATPDVVDASVAPDAVEAP